MSILSILGGKQKKYKGRVEFYRDGVKVDEIPITHLEADKDKVVSKSIEIFNDSDPCVIRYTNCNLQIIYSFLDYLNAEKLDCIGYIYEVDEFCDEYSDYIDTKSLCDLCTYSGATGVRLI